MCSIRRLVGTTMSKQKSLYIIGLVIVSIFSVWYIKKERFDVKPKVEINEDAFTFETTTAIDFEALSDYGLPIMIDYGSEDCVPCQQMWPELVAFYEEYKGKAIIKFIDVWAYPEGAQNVPVQVIPTQVFFNSDGTPLTPSDKLNQQIPFTMYLTKDTNEHVFTVHQGALTKEEMITILTEMGMVND